MRRVRSTWTSAKVSTGSLRDRGRPSARRMRPATARPRIGVPFYMFDTGNVKEAGAPAKIDPVTAAPTRRISQDMETRTRRAECPARRYPDAAIRSRGAGASRCFCSANCRKIFGGAQGAARRVVRVMPGEIHGLLGKNGSGKSTLVKFSRDSTPRTRTGGLNSTAPPSICRCGRATFAGLGMTLRAPEPRPRALADGAGESAALPNSRHAGAASSTGATAAAAVEALARL